jgi:membrane protein YqaA with SNARE-associated domain
MTGGVEGTVGIYAGSFAIAMLSGVVPIVNAELYLVGVVLAVGGVPEALVLAVVVALGQMIAKAVLYQSARGVTNGVTKLGRKRTPKLERMIERARAKVERWRGKPLSVTFVSASVGLPPFYLVSVVAGMLEVRFRAFFAVGLLGRTLRFGTIAVLAAIA